MTSTQPTVSIIIPVHNDPNGISTTLTSLSKQDYPHDNWEIIVVDNNSSDNTVQIANLFKNNIPQLKITAETKQSSYAARNKGISVAHGEILAFIDSDMSVESDWIKKGVRAIIEQNADYVGCAIHIYPVNNPPTVSELFNTYSGFPVKNYIEEHGFAPTAGVFVKRSVITVVGSFHAELVTGGDREFGQRVNRAGFRQVYSADNIMQHPARTFKSLIKKSFRTGKGKIPHQMDLGKPLTSIIADCFRLLFPPRFSNINNFIQHYQAIELDNNKIGLYFVMYLNTAFHQLGAFSILPSILKKRKPKTFVVGS